MNIHIFGKRLTFLHCRFYFNCGDSILGPKQHLELLLGVVSSVVLKSLTLSSNLSDLTPTILKFSKRLSIGFISVWSYFSSVVWKWPWASGNENLVSTLGSSSSIIESPLILLFNSLRSLNCFNIGLNASSSSSSLLESETSRTSSS